MASCSPPAPPATATDAATPYFPPELLPEVARRLTSLQDFFALRGSCRAYRAALPLTPSNLASQAPLLLLVPDRERERERDQAAESPALYHLPLRRLLRFRLPHSRHQSSSFFSLGCRVFIYDHQTDDPSRSELRMVHLLTGEQTRLPTPAGSYSRFVLSGDLLLAWNYYCCAFKSHRLGAAAATAGWRVASIWDSYSLQAMVCVNGTIYVLVESYFFDSPVYHVAAVELSDDRNSAELAFLCALDPQALELPVDAELCLDLAECRGELVLVAVLEYDPRVYRVFKWSSGEDEWVRITSLGGCALFFGFAGYFVGCLGPHHPGIRDDCLYFNDKGLWSEFSFVDGAFRRSEDAVYPQGSWASSVWVFPSMC